MSKINLKPFSRRQGYFLKDVIFDVLPLALQQFTVGRSEVARGYGDRFIFALLEKTNASHVGSNQCQHGFPVCLRISSCRKYRRERKFNAELGEIEKSCRAPRRRR